MGNNCKPVIVKESFDVHDMDDIIKTEKWLTAEGVK
jgi:N-acylneuraminate cytidylyltransferase